MKTIFCLIALTFISVHPSPGQGAAGVIAKQRAKDVVNQNNVRQGVNAPAGNPAQSPAQSGQSPKADPVSKLRACIASMTGASAVSAEQKKQLTADVFACARGSKKPAMATVEKFSNALADAIAKHVG